MSMTTPYDAIAAEIDRRQIDRSTPLLVALDGRSGTGKSTLARIVAALVAATVVESDDFYAGGTDADWAARSVPERIAQVIDWRRLKTEVLVPLRAGRTATYHPFNFKTGCGLAPEPVRCEPAPVIILDGVYSGRPELADLVDLAVLVEMTKDAERRHRLIAREGEMFMTAWHAIWDDAETAYFAEVRPRDTFDLVVTNG